MLIFGSLEDSLPESRSESLPESFLSCIPEADNAAAVKAARHRQAEQAEKSTITHAVIINP
jgi:hypothetical protein